MSNNLRLMEAVENLPSHYHETFSQDFIQLLAALRLHGFSIQRADEAQATIGLDQDLWSELSHSSVWIHAPSKAVDELHKAEAGSPDHTRYSNEVIRANLAEQQRLLSLLEEFYATRMPVSFNARLIVETIDLGESNLRPQGASVRLLSDSETQKRWADEYVAELGAFRDFLASVHDEDK